MATALSLPCGRVDLKQFLGALASKGFNPSKRIGFHISLYKLSGSRGFVSKTKHDIKGVFGLNSLLVLHGMMYGGMQASFLTVALIISL